MSSGKNSNRNRPLGERKRRKGKKRKMNRYKLEIKPAIAPEERHKIQSVLQKLGYQVIGGGTDTDMSVCDISFEIKDKGN